MQSWYTSRKANLRVDNGRLVINARQDNATELQAVQQGCWDSCGQSCAAQGFLPGTQSLIDCTIACGENRCPAIKFTSSRIRTSNSFSVAPSAQYSTVRIAARIKVSSGEGLWPAFWMLPDSQQSSNCSGCGVYGGWPASGEIDIAELGSDNGTMSLLTGSLHYGGPADYASKVTSSFIRPGVYHTYAVEWSLSEIRFKVNHRIFGRINNTVSGQGWFSTGPGAQASSPFNQPFYIILNMAVGGAYVGNPSVSTISSTLSQGPKQMEVDWVRVWGLHDILPP